MTTDVGTASDPLVQACTDEAPGLEHDWRDGVCAWCPALRCDRTADGQRCLDPVGHVMEHRNRLGRRWVTPKPAVDVDAP
jgi:hypothetical protein